METSYDVAQVGALIGYDSTFCNFLQLSVIVLEDPAKFCKGSIDCLNTILY